MSDPAAVIWHDLECGSYREDLPLWTALADRHGGPVLDIGAGTGRVTLALARAGHAVTALDRDPELLQTLARRAEGLPVRTVLADARRFTVPDRFPLIVVPMQTVQLLGPSDDRLSFLRCAHNALAPGGRLAIAIAEALEPFDVSAGFPALLPDVTEIDGTVFSSLPLAVREVEGGFVLERRRETVTVDGGHIAEPDAICLSAVDAQTLEAEARAAGFTVAPRGLVATTADYVGSTVVILDA
jgi:SAM-dependent methyltransferase